MEWVALVTWVVTAGLGFVMLAIWLQRGGMQQSRGIRPPLILGHFLLAAAGLVVWIIYVATDSDALAWIAFVALAIVAALGWTMFAIWWRARKTGVAAATEMRPGPAEHAFPIPVIALHGVFAVVTVLLVFLTAIGVGED
jgi:hypothetical protein